MIAVDSSVMWTQAFDKNLKQNEAQSCGINTQGCPSGGVMYLVFTYMPGELYTEDVPQVEFMYLIFTHMPGEGYCR